MPFVRAELRGWNGKGRPRIPPLWCQPFLSSVLRNLPGPRLHPRPHHRGGLPASWDTPCQADGQWETSCPPHTAQGPRWLRNSPSPRTPAPLREDPGENKGAPPEVRRQGGASVALCHGFLEEPQCVSSGPECAQPRFSLGHPGRGRRVILPASS